MFRRLLAAAAKSATHSASRAALLTATLVTPAAAQQEAPRPTLVVFITVDQMRADYFERFKSQLTGGLKRLHDGGAFFTQAYQDHGITETAPGHASTMSGRFPVHTGIVMNSQGVNTREAPLINAPEIGASPFRFQGTTLTDWMRAVDSRMRFLSVSRKDRGAILPIGRSKGDVYWWSGNGTFTTSKYYTDTLPSWVNQFNGRKMAQSYAGKTWDLLLPKSAYPEPDSVSIESLGIDYVFPHEMANDADYAAKNMAGFPWMDDITLAFALEGLKQKELGASPDRTDLLAVSLSTTDAIGHRFGPDSRELHDQIMRLDRSLGVCLDSLFKMRDERRIIVALTGDHGMSPFPTLKSTIYPNQNAKRVSLDYPLSALRQRLADAAVDTLAVQFDDGVMVVTKPDAFTKAGLKADSVLADFARDIRQVQGVARADLITELAKADTVTDTIARRWLHQFPVNGSARMIITLTQYSYWMGTTYATHGSPWDNDANVPVLFWGNGIKPGVFTDFVRVVDMAPTLAELLKVKPLEKLDGVPLRQVVR
jgi:predicted AlkP superfamily pyrophosphatase or phosphodiesterase